MDTCAYDKGCHAYRENHLLSTNYNVVQFKSNLIQFRSNNFSLEKREWY